MIEERYSDVHIETPSGRTIVFRLHVWMDADQFIHGTIRPPEYGSDVSLAERAVAEDLAGKYLHERLNLMRTAIRRANPPPKSNLEKSMESLLFSYAMDAPYPRTKRGTLE